MKTTVKFPQKKPNLKSWTCPICGKTVNSRGAASHVKNAHGINWKKEYLDCPYLLTCKLEKEQKRQYFTGLDYRHNDLASRIVSTHSGISVEIIKAVARNDKQMVMKFEIMLSQVYRRMKQIKETNDLE